MEDYRKLMFGGLMFVSLLVIGAFVAQVPSCQDKCQEDCNLEALAVDYCSVPYGYAEADYLDLPRDMRVPNWGGGSCVHASTVVLLKWQGQAKMAEWWRQAYSGGENSGRLAQRMESAGLRYAFTVSGDVEFLEWVTRTRRGAGISYYPNHAINFCGFASKDGRDYAVLLDNNRINTYIYVDKAEFVRSWKSYGGWAWSVVYSPPPPVPFI
jgi:hypothetical protein